VVLKSSAYSCAVDLWAAGTIAAELITLKPLFPGKSDVDQLARIGSVLGSPVPRLPPAEGIATDRPNSATCGGEWKEGVHLANRMGFTFPVVSAHDLTNSFCSLFRVERNGDSMILTRSCSQWVNRSQSKH